MKSYIGYTYSVSEFFLDIGAEPGMFSDIMVEAAKSVGFCFLGIIFTWGIISQGNKQKRKEAEALRRSIGS